MEHAENIQRKDTMSDYLVERLEDLTHGQQFTREYLKADFLTAAALSLVDIRRKTGLTQAQVAECLHTKQSAIARMEADFDGTMSLRRYVDFVLACGYIPHQLTFIPIETAQAFTIAQPEKPLTFENQTNWSNRTFQVNGEAATKVPVVFTVPQSATTLQEANPKENVYGSSAAMKMTIQEVECSSGTIDIAA